MYTSRLNARPNWLAIVAPAIIALTLTVATFSVFTLTERVELASADSSPVGWTVIVEG